MSNLTLSSGAHLDAQGAVVLRVANRFGRTNGGVIGPAPGVTPTARGVRLEVSGTNGTTGAITATPKAAAFGTGNTVRALVLLPNGTLFADTGFAGTGAFLGRDTDFVTA
jgi:hypothetical protein